jgi:hypothetical protein
MNKQIIELTGKVIEVDDQIFYATTHGNMQIGRVIELSEDGSIKVIGKGNKREMKIQSPESQVALKSKGYYQKRKFRGA